jgi:hypothetical protein
VHAMHVNGVDEEGILCVMHYGIICVIHHGIMCAIRHGIIFVIHYGIIFVIHYGILTAVMAVMADDEENQRVHDASSSALNRTHQTTGAFKAYNNHQKHRQ